MAEIQRIGDLEIPVDEEFQRKEWRAERIGWVVMVLIVLSGLTGLLGGAGFLSNATAGAEGEPLRVDYLRFVTLLGSTELRMHLRPEADQSEVRIKFNQGYLDAFEILSMAPEPESVEAAVDGQIYVFQLSELENATTLVLHVRGEHIGSYQARITLDNRQTIEFSQFVYP